MRTLLFSCLLLLGIAAGCSEKQIYESQTMAATVAPAVSGISSGAYEKYTGTFQMQQASFNEVAITTENGKLFAQATGERVVEIFPEKEHTFSIPAFNAKITFIPTADSTFTEITILLEGNELKGVRK
ncbi:hypothetical protein GXP67_10470 [Rhodocytophaga rosea]|uniref:DUF3471 domain-containing protein n=1 Tax=Rhodocytophaga rosea TaxID=2704465 RepID=A0A6C0GH68_9BACT|nr:hypothetical protein [Rhodocytophaga rosea]QHT67040.1 hypothetical protein GXP67_10470 [Rhodocytophaga rosea]